MNWDELRPYTGIDIRDFVVTGSKAFALTGDELYKQIYRTTNRFDPNNVELCISKIGGVKKDGLFTRSKRDMEVINILQQGDTGIYNPQIVHLHLEHYKEIWFTVTHARELIEGRYVFGEEGEGMLEPTFAQMKEGANILKPVYEKYREFEFDAKLYRAGYRMPWFVWEFFNLCETAKIFWDDEPTQIIKPQQIPQKRKGTPKNVLTERAKKYFQRAIEAGYMEETATGYKWGHDMRGDKIKLGYFLKTVYNPKESSQIPYGALETLFRESRLDSTIGKIADWKNTPKWVEEINNTLFYD